LQSYHLISSAEQPKNWNQDKKNINQNLTEIEQLVVNMDDFIDQNPSWLVANSTELKSFFKI